MYSSLVSLALLANAVAALPQGWGSWVTLSSTSISKTTTSSTISTNEGTTRETSQVWTSPSASKTSVASTITTTSTVEDPGWGNWQPSTLSTSPATSKSVQVKSTRKPSGSASTTSTTSPYTDPLAVGWSNWNASLSDPFSHTGTDHAKHSTSASTSASSIPAYSSSISSGQSSSTLAGQSWSDWSQSSSMTDALYTAAIPTATLVPVIPWNHDGQAPEHLRPDGQKQIYFASEGQGSTDSFHQFAALALNFTSETVLLDHSDFLSHDYEDGSSSVLITFTTEEAFDIAQSSWTAGLILGVTDGECGQSGAGCFLLSTAITFDEESLSCMVSVTSLNFDEACHGFQIDWGHYTPSQGSGVTATADTSSSTTVNDANCAAPQDDVFNLPTACLGPNFDDDLDESYGLESIGDSSFSNFLTEYPNLGLDDEDTGAVEKRHSKRQSAASASASYRRPIEIFSTSFDFPQSPNLVDSPWGEQLLIKQFTAGNAPAGQGLPGNLAVYCVDCRLSGGVDVTGSAQVSFFHGISDLGIRANANMAMSLNVGVDAQIQYQGGYKGTLFNVPLTPFTISTLVSVGPYMEMGVDLGFKANAAGQLLAGASLSWPNAFADVSVLPKLGTSSGGFKPDFQPTLQANGSIDLSANLGLPIEIGVGFSALGFELKASIVESPSISGNATAAVVIDNVVQTLDGCNGIKTSLSLHNELYAQVTGFKKVNILPPATWNLGPDCLGYTGGQGVESNGAGGGLSTNTNTNTNVTISQSNDSNTIANGGSSTKKVCGPYSTSPCQATSTTSSNSSVRDSTGEIPIVATGVASGISTSSSFSSSSSSSSSDTSFDTSSYIQTTLIDSSTNSQVYPCLDGNVYLFDINDTTSISTVESQYGADNIKWTMTQDQDEDATIIITDSLARVPIYFPDEMSKTGVSRLRLVDVDGGIPNGANELLFKTGTSNDDENQASPVHHVENPTTGDKFYPVVCSYTDDSLPPKVFVVQDQTLGPVTLTLPAVKYSITGGDVSSCEVLELIQGAGESTSPDDDDSAETGEWKSVLWR